MIYRGVPATSTTDTHPSTDPGSTGQIEITPEPWLTPDAGRRLGRRLLHPADHGLGDKLADLAHLTDDDRHILLGVIDALATKAKLRLITGGAG